MIFFTQDHNGKPSFHHQSQFCERNRYLPFHIAVAIADKLVLHNFVNQNSRDPMRTHFIITQFRYNLINSC